MLPDTIQIGSNPESLVGNFLHAKSYSQVVILVDSNTRSQCYPRVQRSLPLHELIEVPAGEVYKSLATCEKVWKALTTLKVDRHGLIIVLGGGVLGDLGGFCAATYKRGVDFLLIPTTLLAQVDASVGGKLGVDFMGYKNHIGVFQEPIATLISPAFLSTLPKRELRSGFAEVIKHCLISDGAMWDKVRGRKLEEQDWIELVGHSVSFKSSVVGEDPREKGRRKILNFGHTVGHAIETLFMESPDPLFHGEAIAAGMVAEGFIARELHLIDTREERELRVYIDGIFEKVPPLDAGRVIENMRQDKKNRDKKILMALPKGIGNAIWDIEVSEELIKESLKRLQANQT